MVRTKHTDGIKTQSDKVDLCTYCGANDSEQNPLCHGEIFGDPYSTVPLHKDYVYCEDCTNGHHSLEHYYFRYCTSCRREFWDSQYVLEDDDPNNPVKETACIACIRTYQTKHDTKCPMCGNVADGFYATGLCAQCEHGCVLCHKDKDLGKTAASSKAPSAHTPAPWKLIEGFSSIVAHLPSGKEVQITCVTPTQFCGNSVTEESEAFKKQTNANAHLIAAAPELLEACNAVSENLDCVKDGGCGSNPCSVCLCRSAITKANARLADVF